MTKSKGINAPKAVWTDDQVATLCRLYPNYRSEDIAFMLGHSLQSVYRKANSLGLSKTADFVAAESARQMNRADHPARASRFQKGFVPWNKGTKGVAGVQEACRATQFTPGQKPHNTLPIGSTKLDKSGVLLQKFSNDKGNNSARWRAVHELVWTKVNGPLPPKHIAVFKPGMHTNVLEEITIDRVECISLAENMKRNTVHNMPKELAVPARVRFLSMEPLLEQVDLFSTMTGELLHTSGNDYEPGWLNWVIVGGESGPGARPMHPDWARNLRDQCASAGVPFLFKQWGEWLPAAAGRSVLGETLILEGATDFRSDPEWHHFIAGDYTSVAHMARIGKKAAGRLLDGVHHDGYPEVP